MIRGLLTEKKKALEIMSGLQVAQVGATSRRSDDIQLSCEWESCTSEIFTDVIKFYEHLVKHFIQEVKTDERGIVMSGEQIMCKWSECNYTTTSYDDMLRHIYFHGYHTKVKWWGMCCVLDERLGQCYLKQNRNILPDLPQGYACEWEGCKNVWDVPEPFYEHVYDHGLYSKCDFDDNGTEMFVCKWKDCKYTYKRRANTKLSLARFKLRDHLRTHTKERKYGCPTCGNLYVNKIKFIDHINRQIEAKNHTFQCTHCSRTFPTERLLKDHVRNHVNHYKCPLCEMTCPNPAAVRNHIKYKHSTDRPHKCKFCSYRAKTIHDLRVHMNFHRTNLAYECCVPGCDYKVRTVQNLRHHLRTFHNQSGAMYVCHVCDSRFVSGSLLTQHLMRTHSFKLPPGHSRFQYKIHDDGNLRLQTFRYDSKNLTVSNAAVPAPAAAAVPPNDDSDEDGDARDDKRTNQILADDGQDAPSTSAPQPHEPLIANLNYIKRRIISSPSRSDKLVTSQQQQHQQKKQTRMPKAKRTSNLASQYGELASPPMLHQETAFEPDSYILELPQSPPQVQSQQQNEALYSLQRVNSGFPSNVVVDRQLTTLHDYDDEQQRSIYDVTPKAVTSLSLSGVSRRKRKVTSSAIEDTVWDDTGANQHFTSTTTIRELSDDEDHDKATNAQERAGEEKKRSESVLQNQEKEDTPIIADQGATEPARQQQHSIEAKPAELHSVEKADESKLMLNENGQVVIVEVLGVQYNISKTEGEDTQTFRLVPVAT